ncbi:SPRY domain-containing protein 7 [Teleopsis dalmanni]|uniref:SPRY domain-containing protein 7 n=1 Tax=Teleopsis dalmanni TaxID=139649 RepID=UPI000D32AA42|nr:SPRY domain-containing protein 7 [Teleopsis dalmanni]
MFCCLRTCFNGNMRKPTKAAQRLREPEIHLDAAHMGPDVVLLSHQLRITGNGAALGTAPLVQSKSYFEIKIQQSGCWSVGLATRQTDFTRKFGGCDKESWCLCSDNATRHNNEEFRPVVVNTQEPTSVPLHSLINSNNNAISETASAAGLIGIEDLPEDVFLPSGNDQILNTDNALATSTERVFPDEGDIIGIAFDHIELNFYFNGKNLETPFRNVKGAVYPVIYVGNGAVIDIILESFNYGPPPGFDKIMLEQSLL